MNSELKQCLLDLKTARLLQRKDYELKNGTISPLFIDFKKVISLPVLLKKISELMWKQISAFSFDYLVAAPNTAIPLATSCSIKYHIPMLSVYQEELVGLVENGASAIVMEDLITTGNNVLRTIEVLAKAGVNVKHVVAFCDRQQGGNEKLASNGIKLHSVSTISQCMEIVR